MRFAWVPTALLAMLCAGAIAQEAPRAVKVPPVGDDKVIELEPFTVTATFRGSLEAAAAAKEAAQSITEVVAAEDIGKLPEASIADALARLTGLSTQRQNGRSQAIGIRGLPGDFSVGMLNGREQVTTGDNRSVEFDQYPAELISEVMVHKTAAPSLTGQGLAGTIDLHTVRPLSEPGRKLAFNSYYEWTQYGGLTPLTRKSGDRVDASWVAQNARRTWGFAAGLAHADKPYAGKQFQAWNYGALPGGELALSGIKPYARTSNLRRDGGVLVVEYKPGANLHGILDLFVSDYEEEVFAGGMEIPLAASWGLSQLQPGYKSEAGVVTEMTLGNVQPVVRNDFVRRKARPISVGGNLVVGGDSSWPVTIDVGYSTVERTDFYFESWSGLGFAGGASSPDTMRVRLVPGGVPVLSPGIDYSDTARFFVTDPQGWQTWMSPIGGSGWLKNLRAKDELGQAKFSVRHALRGWLKDLELGVSHTRRRKSGGEDGGLPVNVSGQPLAPLPSLRGTTNLGFLGLGRLYAYDPMELLDRGTVTIVPNPYSADMVAAGFAVEEGVTQVYGQLDGDWRRGPVRATGNVGLRAIRADQESTGFSSDGFNLIPVSGRARYWDLAPSLNLNLAVHERTWIRLGAARQFARPRMTDMRAGLSWYYVPGLAGSTDVNQSPWGAFGGGNAALRPWKADALDLSIERYFRDQRGYWAVAAFTKRLHNYIYVQQQVRDFTGYPVKGPVAPALWQGIVSMPANGEGGTLRGVEATLSLTSEMLAKDLKGLGVIAGIAWVDSDIAPWGPGFPDVPLAGLSRRTANLTGYFERGGFSARVSCRYRSASRQHTLHFNIADRAQDTGPNADFTEAQAETVVDAQLSFAPRAGRAAGLRLFVQAYNLNNEPLRTYQGGDRRLVQNHQSYGASYAAGVSCRF